MSSFNFKFDLNCNVRIVCSDEIGEVIGRAEYKHSNNSYLIRYRSADGGAVENWWSEDALELTE